MDKAKEYCLTDEERSEVAWQYTRLLDEENAELPDSIICLTDEERSEVAWQYTCQIDEERDKVV